MVAYPDCSVVVVDHEKACAIKLSEIVAMGLYFPQESFLSTKRNNFKTLGGFRKWDLLPAFRYQGCKLALFRLIWEQFLPVKRQMSKLVKGGKRRA